MRQNQKRIDIIISVVAAILLWIYVINIANPTVRTVVRDVPVEITGEAALMQNGRALAYTEPFTTNVTVSGPRNDVNSIHADDISLTIDVSNLALGKQAVEIKSVLPHQIELEELQYSSMDVLVENYSTVPKPVEVILAGAEEGEEVKILSLSLSQIEVSGAESIISQVESVRASGDLSDAGLDSPKELALAVTPVDSSGKAMDAVHVAQDSVNVLAAVYQTKEVPLSVSFVGEPWAGVSVSGTKVQESVVIIGPAAYLSQISEVTANPINIEGIYETTDFPVELQLSEGVFLSEAVGSIMATVSIDEEGKLTFVYPTAETQIRNLESGLTAYVSGEGAPQITLTVTGRVSTLRTLAAGDVAPWVDADGKDEGEYTLKLSPNQKIVGLNVTYEPASVKVVIQ